MSFDLPTFGVGTAFDAPQLALPPDFDLKDGAHPAVVLLNSANRAKGRLLRANRVDPVVGIRVEPATGPVRVTVVLALDRAAWDRWAAAGPGVSGADPLTHRLVSVVGQGEVRGHALFAPREGQALLRERLDFILQPVELGELLVLGLEPAQTGEGWSQPLPDGVVGLFMARVVVRPVVEPFGAQLSTGRPRAAEGPVRIPATPGYAAVNPGSTAAGVDLLLTPSGAGAGTVTRVQVTRAGGEMLLDELASPGEAGTLVIPVGELSEPVLVRAVPEGRDRMAYMVRMRR